MSSSNCFARHTGQFDVVVGGPVDARVCCLSRGVIEVFEHDCEADLGPAEQTREGRAGPCTLYVTQILSRFES